MVSTCVELHALPGAGGWLDQDQLIARKMEIVLEAMRDLQEKKQQEKDTELERAQSKIVRSRRR